MQSVMIKSNRSRFTARDSVYLVPHRNVFVGAGSLLATSETASCPASVKRIIADLQSRGIIRELDGRLTFVVAHLFDNPNAAATVLSRSSVDPRESFTVQDTGITLKSFDHMNGLKTKAGK